MTRTTECPGCGAPARSLLPGARCSHCKQVLVPIQQIPAHLRTAQTAGTYAPRGRLGCRPAMGWLLIVAVANIPILLSYTAEYGRVPLVEEEGAILAAILTFIPSWTFILRVYEPMGKALAIGVGLFLFFKPLAAPLWYVNLSPTGTQSYAHDFTYETHLYFVFSGLVLLTIPPLHYFFSGPEK